MISEELLAASKTWARTDWGDFPETLPEGVERLDFAKLSSTVEVVEKLSPNCPICDTPLVLLRSPPTKKNPTLCLTCFCVPCNLAMGNNITYHSWPRTLVDDILARRMGEVIYSYHQLVVQIATDIPGYIKRRDEWFAELQRKKQEEKQPNIT